MKSVAKSYRNNSMTATEKIRYLVNLKGRAWIANKLKVADTTVGNWLNSNVSIKGPALILIDNLYRETQKAPSGLVLDFVKTRLPSNGLSLQEEIHSAMGILKVLSQLSEKDLQVLINQV